MFSGIFSRNLTRIQDTIFYNVQALTSIPFLASEARYPKHSSIHMIKKYQPGTTINGLLFTVLIVTLSSILFSCKVYRPTYYFRDIKRDTTIIGFINNDLELKIQKNDVLAIAISSLNPAEDALYNTGTIVAPNTTGYQVTPEGNIFIHKLGKLQISGLTRQQLKNKLEADLSPYLKDPIVTVNFANHRITVFGETGSTIVPMPEDKIALLDVMAQATGITINSKLDEVMIIRENGNTKQFKHLNLEDQTIFTSPWYYLQPNDIIVVKPNEEKIYADQKRIRNQLLYTTIISGISFVFLIIDRITR